MNENWVYFVYSYDLVVGFFNVLSLVFCEDFFEGFLVLLWWCFGGCCVFF